MSGLKSRELRLRNRPLVRATFFLSAGLIVATLLIALVSYNYSFEMMERSYQTFYLNKAQMIVKAAEPYLRGSDAELLAAMNRYWNAAVNKPPDEYICVVDQQGRLLLHTALPETVGNYAGDNPILGGEEVQEKRLCELVDSQRPYVGKYISSQGKDQIAAFVGIPDRKWMLGVHRSRSALSQEIAEGFRPLLIGFLLVCGLLMPLSLFALYKIYSAVQRRHVASELALRESERRYQSLVDVMPQCLYRTDLQGRITFANRAFLETLGLELEDCLGKTARELMPADLARQQLADDVKVIRTGRTLDVVVELPLPGEERGRFFELVKSPVTDSRGEIVGVQGIFWDVTDKRRAEQRLQYTKAQLEAILQSVPSGIIAVDPAGRFTLVNHKAEEILGFSAREALGRPVEEFVPDSGLTRAISRHRSEFGKPYRWRDKTLMLSRSPIYQGGKVVGAVAVFHDESELESVQRQLAQIKRLNDEYSCLVQNSHDGVMIADQDRVIKVNPSFGRITGLPPSAVEGQKVAELDGESHKCLALVQEVFRRVTSQGKSLTVRRKIDGGNEIFITGNPVLDGEGRVVRVVMNIRDVTELHTLDEQIKRLSLACLEPDPGQARTAAPLRGVVAESPVTKNLLELCLRVARVDSTVLLTGESGVGKDVLARLIHDLSARHRRPFVAVNCGAIPENLLESELFGYEKGAFSGAQSQGKPGLFEEANGGTVFLDEVGELPLNLQVKLLKVIQEHRCRRLGSVRDVELDLRVIAATNRDLKQMVAAGSFREDLFYRLYVVPIEVPPLRDRREDILPLALRFLKTYNRKYGVTRTLSQDLLDVLERYPWPGNVRELQNVIERMVVTADADVLEPRHLPDSLRARTRTPSPGLQVPEGLTLREAREMVERLLIERALARGGNTRRAAKLLGVTHPTVIRKAQKFGLAVGGTMSRSLH